MGLQQAGKSRLQPWNPGTDVTDILFPKKPDAEVGQPAAKH